MDPEEMEEWRTIFNLFDVDGDQSITHEELGIVLRSMGQNPSEQELIDMISEMDEDGSGTVDFEVCSEFCRVVLQGNIIGICDIDEEENRRLRFY